MMHLLITCFLITTVSLFPFNLTVDYRQLRQKYGYNDGKCVFEESELTMATVAKWPTECVSVCGVVTINEKFDVPKETLKKTWKKLQTLNGGFRIVNSNLKSLSFLPPFEIVCDAVGSYILNNSVLENVDAISYVYEYVQPYDKCTLAIDKNPKLNSTSICNDAVFIDRFGVQEGFQVTDNKVDCGCQGLVTPETKWKFENCSKVVGKLTISGFQNETDGIPLLSNITVINGDLEITNNALKHFSFLANFSSMKSMTHESIERININIHDNLKMTKLGFKGFKEFINTDIFGHLTMNFHNLHPDFCLSVFEMAYFLRMNVKFVNIEATYCPDSFPQNSSNVCVFDTMKSLKTGCVYLIGDLLIDSGDEEHVEKLKDVAYVMGTVTIRNTMFEDVGFLGKLKRVANLNESLVTMRILSNRNLQKLDFPVLGIFTSRSAANNRVILSGNHPNLFAKVLDCLEFQYRAQTNVSISGGRCKSIPHHLFQQDYTVAKGEFNTDVDLDDVDYSEEARAPWITLTDGYTPLDASTINLIFRVAQNWKHVNFVAAGIGFLVNIFHLIVLLHHGLRANFIFILLIAICLCDLLFTATFIIKHLLDSGWIYEQSKLADFHFLINQLQVLIQQITRKTSAFIGFFLSLITVLSAMKSKISPIHRAKWAVIAILVVVLVQGVWNSVLFVLCKERNLEDILENRFDYVQCVGNLPLQILIFIDGTITVLLAILYLIVIIFLLKTIRNQRKSSKPNKGNTRFVTVLSITFLVSEGAFGVFFASQKYFEMRYGNVSSIMKQFPVFLWFLAIVNSTIHCLVCFLRSMEYRGQVKMMFGCGGGRNENEKGNEKNT